MWVFLFSQKKTKETAWSLLTYAWDQSLDQSEYFLLHQQWLSTLSWSWRGDICTLVTGCKKPNKSDQTHSSIRPGYQFLLSSQKDLKRGFIVTWWPFKEKMSLLLLSYNCRQWVIDLTLNASEEKKEKSEIHAVWDTVFVQNTQRANTSSLRRLTHSLFL